ncbi:hypothetical protein PRZ48_006632 [Zasmidium cellare]|uniref:Heterokaryon incompatibility domain-containing protein n=1 Tax=Zasmidium cellare TaxID=395010 RepID=A0ABR0EPA1_ZASCE|nr:hypothetical protein PRZ48_006632 [Zasmidium cellare]
MRLLNVHTRTLHEFSSEPPAFLITSHTWENEEVQQWELDDLESVRRMKPKSAKKIDVFLDHAAKAGYDWMWMDTICIDQTNDEEVSAAVNAMYQWYEGAAVCLAYLSDVSLASSGGWGEQFKASKWFTRGWTLQELLAPRNVIFLDKNGQRLGSLHDEKILGLVEETTGIPPDILTHKTPVHKAPVAQRMAWAAQRRTKRPEDIAYSLLGIFGVNTKLSYGEGAERAFVRLQEEILRMTDDPSIFAWRMVPGMPTGQYGLFAPSPKCFVDAEGSVCGVPSETRQALNDSYLGLSKEGLRVPADRNECLTLPFVEKMGP